MHFKKFKRGLSSSFLVIALFAPASFMLRLQAQSITGGVTGTVTDPSGAAIPGAVVTAHDLDTNVSTPTTTNSKGDYHIEHLPIGRYEVIASAKGFSSQKLPSFSLEALQTVTFNAKLGVQGNTSTVNVSSAEPILDTQDDTISTTFTANTIANFPLNGLDFSALTLYTPGSVSTFGNTGTTGIGRDTYYSDSVNVDGNRAQANNYTLEGFDMNETFNNEIGYNPAPAALQQVQVLTANSPAEFGNVNGAGVVSVLKSGTNEYHGSLYGYLQDYRFNADSWQNKNQRPIIPTNPYSQDQFGGTFGGPILHNKLFYFVDYLGSRYHVGGVGSESVLTAAMRNGDFSALLPEGCDSSGYTTIAGVATCNSTGATDSFQLFDTLNNNQPFVGNVGVPIVNPVAQFLISNSSLYPLPNATPTDGIAANNYQAPQRNYTANNQGDIKIEYDKSAKDLFTGFYSMSTVYNGTTPVLAISFTGPNLYPTKLGGVNWVHTFSPAFVNSMRIGFTRIVWKQNFPVDTTGQFGYAGDSKVGVFFPDQQVTQGFTYQGIGGGIFAGGNPGYGGGVTDNTYQYLDQASWQHGKHYFDFGFSALRYQNNYPTANNYGYLGSLNYAGQYSSDSANSTGGYGAADFLLDRISSAAATLASVNVGQRQWRTGIYAIDEFKATPTLTLNYGFRYELDQPWIEQHNKTGNVNLTTGQIIYAGSVPANAPAGSGLCSNLGCYDWSFHQFMPRFGFAWQATNRFVVRGGYNGTSFFEGNSSNQRLTSITPFIQALQTVTLAVAAGNVPKPFTTQTAFNVAASPGGTYNTYPQNIQPAYVQDYNLTLEYALTNSLTLQVGYVGETGQHIEDYGNVNQWKIAGDPASAPFYNSPYIGCNSPLATQVCSNGLLITESRAMMNYNGLQVVLRQREVNGLEYTINYAYSKSMTNAVGNYGLNDGGYNADPGFQNYYDSAADYGVAGSDIKHNLNGTAVYALPLGRGLKYMSNANRFVDEALGGWKIAASFMFYSGFPQTIAAGNSNVNSYGLTRAEQYRPLHIVNRSRYHWFGTDPSAQPCTTAGVDNGVCAFGIPAQNTFGNSVNGVVRGPGFRDVDLSGFKEFRIVRQQFLTFRVDAFNAFNMVSFGNPNLSMSPEFGWLAQNNAIRSVERHLQLSASYQF
ncbi:MAG: carboxypeptidase regulatory-like domain-containing protein [Acidobacteriaceae bacterium]